ncbi:MAG: molybdopterin-dependent oxidoreductase [Verrucomicrobia bacterium]|nr:molybdopterin-dependent oxidoreductase [Verrucomicrobiota bacterium]MDA1065039.1 molybdopterin-dependent oxidoreductase [Verrucomicrobiota bacterium]
MKSKDNNPISRRGFVIKSTAIAATTFAGKAISHAAETPESIASNYPGGPVCPFPALTPAEDFYTVARGNPKPHTLTGQALENARMTPASWRLEITADPFIEEPNIQLPATVNHPLTLADGTALDLPMLLELGKMKSVKYIKAMQCLNIPSPLGQGLWEGVPLRDILGLCGSMNNVRRIYYWGFHNNDPEQIFQSSVSYTQAMETPPGELPVFLAYKLNGKPIPPIRGGPVRMVVTWSHGFKSVKWLQHIFLTNDYRSNDTYALKNNDPESFLKTAAYTTEIPEKVSSGKILTVTGQVISGLSGLERVECWVRKVGAEQEPLDDDDPEFVSAPWKPCHIYPQPDWSVELPNGISTKNILGFDPKTGEPKTWPLRFGVGFWFTEINNLKPGHYEVRARAVDLNGYAQPEPRPAARSGKNGIQVRQFEVV